MNNPLCPCLSLLAFVCLAAGVDALPPYSMDVANWVEVKVPPRHTDSGAWAVWFYSANYSEMGWRVYVTDGRVQADLMRKEWNPLKLIRPPFSTKVGKYRECYVAERVADGWLVGYNEGEWGGALYWFNHDGTQSYRISDDQIVSFFRLPDGFYAVEGCGHMGLNNGSVIRIARPTTGDQWSAKTVTELPDAPAGASVLSDGKTVIVGEDSLMVLDPNGKARTLLADAPWGALYPSTSVLSHDERKLYIGLTQYVAELDLMSRKLRLLVPSKAFINRLPKDDQARIYKQYTQLKPSK